MLQLSPEVRDWPSQHRSHSVAAAVVCREKYLHGGRPQQEQGRQHRQQQLKRPWEPPRWVPWQFLPGASHNALRLLSAVVVLLVGVYDTRYNDVVHSHDCTSYDCIYVAYRSQTKFKPIIIIMWQVTENVATQNCTVSECDRTRGCGGGADWLVREGEKLQLRTIKRAAATQTRHIIR